MRITVVRLISQIFMGLFFFSALSRSSATSRYPVSVFLEVDPGRHCYGDHDAHAAGIGLVAVLLIPTLFLGRFSAVDRPTVYAITGWLFARRTITET